MTTATKTTTDVRAEYIAGLRALAGMLEANPDLDLPHTGNKYSPLLVIPGADQKAQAAAWAKALPGKKSKKDRGAALDLLGSLHGLHIQLILDRAEVCDRVVTGTREVTEEVPDPEALAAVPTVTVTKTVEDIEWICRPLLGELVA